ncbi:MAG: sigma-70 family RNA polymerase sigma factor [Desulfitobacteriaceae bacterium]|nr:sigma-70 family RNA polymerase sigma factor [Desulfitobacteriaceae bacterium]
MFDIDDIYKEYAETVFKFLIILCNDEDTAEELTQETFYRAIRSANRYDGTCKVSTWLCQIAKHLWYQEIDKRNRKETSMLNDNIVSNKFNPEEELCLIEDKMQLIKAVHILDETAKEIVLLRITGAFSFREIGEVFNKNENWARVTFYRAKQKIMKGRL